jgi:hypothetical protein
MKKMKIVSGLMAMAMSASVLTAGLSASAADPVTVTIGKETKNPGETFSVTVDLASVPSAGLSTIDFAINYDDAVIDITGVELGSIANTCAKAAEGDLGDTLFEWKDTGKQIVIVWATGSTDSSNWISKDGTLLTISGKVDSTAKAGDVSKLQGVAVNRAKYPKASGENADIIFSGVKGKTDITDYSALMIDGEVAVGSAVTTTTSTTTTTTTTSTNDDPSDLLYGDVNCDNAVDVKDAVYLARNVGGDATAVLSAKGEKNADVAKNDKIDPNDLSKLLRFLARLIPNTDLGKA